MSFHKSRFEQQALSKSEKELLQEITNFEIDISINDTNPIREIFKALLHFELESMIEYPDATPFYKKKKQLEKILEKL